MLFLKKGSLLQGHVTILWKLIACISHLNLLTCSCNDPYLCVNDRSRHEALIYLGWPLKYMTDDINCRIYLLLFYSKMEKWALDI